MYGRRYSKIFRRNGYAPFLKLPEVQFSSASDRGLFKSTNSGKTWKQVHAGGLVGKLVESNGVLLATSMRGIIRSTDDGENWAVVISEGGVGIDVERIKGGFAAITVQYRVEYQESDEHPTTAVKPGSPLMPADKVFIDSIWRTWDDRPRVQAFMTSIIQVGENFFCGHPNGIFRSSDKGKTWKLLLPSVEDKVFNLFVSGNVIYAIPSKGGC